MSIFSNRLRDIRNKRGLLQKELAVSISVGPVTLSQYESGKREPDFDKLVLICKNLNVSADFLLGLSDSPYCSAKKRTEEAYNFGSLLDAVTPRDPLSNLDDDLRDQANSYIAYLNEQQKQRDAADKKVKA